MSMAAKYIGLSEKKNFLLQKKYERSKHVVSFLYVGKYMKKEVFFVKHFTHFKCKNFLKNIDRPIYVVANDILICYSYIRTFA